MRDVQRNFEREALALRREQGIVLGRRKGSCTKLRLLADDRTRIVRLLNDGTSIAAICREYGVARNTFDRFRKQYVCVILRAGRPRYRVKPTMKAE